MSITKIAEHKVAGQHDTFIEIDSESFDEYYTVQYGGSGCTFDKDQTEAAVDDYLSNIRHQLESSNSL